MFVAGIDAHATYSVTCVVSKQGQLVADPTRLRYCRTSNLMSHNQVRLRFNRFRHRSWYHHTACAAGGMGRL